MATKREASALNAVARQTVRGDVGRVDDLDEDLLLNSGTGCTSAAACHTLHGQFEVDYRPSDFKWLARSSQRSCIVRRSQLKLQVERCAPSLGLQNRLNSTILDRGAASYSTGAMARCIADLRIQAEFGADETSNSNRTSIAKRDLFKSCALVVCMLHRRTRSAIEGAAGIREARQRGGHRRATGVFGWRGWRSREGPVQTETDETRTSDGSIVRCKERSQGPTAI